MWQQVLSSAALWAIVGMTPTTPTARTEQ